MLESLLFLAFLLGKIIMSDIIPYTDQIPFEAIEFAENPEPRCPCVLLLDTSYSMSGEPIEQLNQGLQLFKEHISADGLASKRIEISVITFGGTVEVFDEFELATNFYPQELKADGGTPMGEAIETAIDLISQRKETYRANGISYYRPWIFLITDGAPTDQWKNAAHKVQIGEESKSFAFYAVGVDQADMNILNQISTRQPLKLKGLNFSSMFEWLSNSMSSVSHSSPTDEVPLSSPLGWGSI